MVGNKRGPAPSGQGVPVLVRLHADLLAPLDAWVNSQPDPKPSRAEAIRIHLRGSLPGVG
jgi:hypothetical protein